MINHEKAMQDALEAVSRLTYRQLIVLQANLSDHILQCYNYAEMRKAQEADKAEVLATDEKTNPRPN